MTIKEYEKWLEEFEKELKEKINSAIKQAQERTLNEYVLNSPVRTGFFRDSWFSTENKIDNSAPYAENIVNQVFEKVSAEKITVEELKKIDVKGIKLEVEEVNE